MNREKKEQILKKSRKRKQNKNQTRWIAERSYRHGPSNLKRNYSSFLFLYSLRFLYSGPYNPYSVGRATYKSSMPIDELAIGFSRSTRHKTTLFFFLLLFFLSLFFFRIEFPRVFPMSVFVTYFLYDLRERGRILPGTSFSAVHKYIPAADATAAARSGAVKIKRLRVASRRRRWQKENPRNKSLRPRSPKGSVTEKKKKRKKKR